MALLGVSGGQIKRNCRIKVYPDGRIAEVLACSLAQWAPPGWELSDRPEKRESTYIGAGSPDEGRRARRRARKRVIDLVNCNTDMDVFWTLTLREGATTETGQAIGRTDYKALNRKLQQWLADRVRRRGLKYVAVYEYHDRVEDDGLRALHVHGVANHSALRLVDSKKKYKDKEGHWHKIYNVADWTLGHTTAMYMYGDRRRAINYVAKYIYKSEKAVGGRWYMHSHNLLEPTYEYVDVDFCAAPGRVIPIAEAGCCYKYINPDDLAQIVIS